MRYTFTELGQGLRRNLSMHLAVVLTLFVSLTLVGLGALLKMQATKAADYWGSELQITVWLCKDRDANASCLGEVTEAQKAAISKVIEDNPEVAGYHFETKDEAFEKLKETYVGKFDGPNSIITADDMPQSVWIELKDPEKFEGIKSAVSGLDGVSDIRDERDTLGPIYSAINRLQWGSLGTSLFLVFAAILLVANTIRLTAFARRREIGIMRLVGASTVYIALPFLLEALVTAAVGVLLAIGALVAFENYVVQGQLASQFVFIPWVDWSQVQVAVLLVAVLGPALTLVPTVVLTGKYLKV
ncbi:permease-like cell division protein FtsX [Nocardioides islandensis]|nr:permease-like cell division protein FtsX [Nocardioides islandensis]